MTDLINIRQFKEKNSYSVQKLKLSKIKERTIVAKLQSINPNIDLSHIEDEMKANQVKAQKDIYCDVYSSSDMTNARYLLPIYNEIDESLLQVLEPAKIDLCQYKRGKMYTPLPKFTPRGYIIPGETLLITISIYYSFHWFRGQFPDEAVRPHCEVSIQLYDSQTLYDVRHAFRCSNVNTEISGDISDVPHKPFEFMGNDDLKCSLFYINNNIYIDSQDEIAKDQSETMKKWAQDNGYTFGDVLSMKTKLIDLEVRLGEPYVYQHLARCEHLLIFNEISFAQSNDSLGRRNYPRIVSAAKGKLKNCIFCNKDISTVAVVPEDDRLPLRVNHLCDQCFSTYCYDTIGEKIGLFKAYRCFKWKN